MPAFYAHQKFAEEVLAQLPEHVQSVVAAHPKAFILGTQGPDILFNYKPFSKNKIKERGMDLHLTKSKAFYERAHALCQEQGAQMQAYVIGFICHFLLDNACHPDIYRLENQGFWHGRIESEFDKHLKRRAGEKVHRNAARVLSHTKGVAETAALVLDVQPEHIRKAVRTMRTVNGLFSIHSRAWQKFAGWVLKKVNGEKFFAMFLHIDGLKETDALNPVLTEYLEKTIPQAVTLITEFFQPKPNVAFFDAFDKDYKGEPIL